MKMLEGLWRWLARKLEDYIADRLQAGGHCGLCGKWVPYDIVVKYWAWTLCDKCARGEFE